MGFPDTNITAAGKRSLEVGVNYEWAFDKYGLYFGLHRGDPLLPATNPTNPFVKVHKDEDMKFDGWIEGGPTILDAKGNSVAAFGSFEQNLVELRSLGVRHVRIFLFCNAFNWGAPDSKGVFQAPPYLHNRFTRHLTDMFTACQRQDVSVMPVLVDFGICQPSQGASRRTDIVKKGAIRNTFFKDVFQPFLKISEDFDDGTILAWDIMNEPYWMSQSIFPQGRTDILPFKPFKNKEFNPVPLDEGDVDDFLQEGLDAVAAKNFTFIGSTVGHRFFSELSSRPTGTLPQFHYYPMRIGPFSIYDERSLRSTRRLPFARPVLGEFAAGSAHDDPWFVLGGKDAPTARKRVRARLELAESLGYTLAYIWPDLRIGTPTATNVDPLKLSADAQEGIKDFVLRRTPPP